MFHLVASLTAISLSAEDASAALDELIPNMVASGKTGESRSSNELPSKLPDRWAGCNLVLLSHQDKHHHHHRLIMQIMTKDPGNRIKLRNVGHQSRLRSHLRGLHQPLQMCLLQQPCRCVQIVRTRTGLRSTVHNLLLCHVGAASGIGRESSALSNPDYVHHSRKIPKISISLTIRAARFFPAMSY